MPKQSAQADIALIVREPFAQYQRGDKIEDAKIIEQILHSEQTQYVNKVSIPEKNQGVK